MNDNKAISELPNPARINEFLPPEENMRYNRLVRRWEYRKNVTDEWQITGLNPLLCPIHHSIRASILGGLLPDATSIGQRGVWTEVLDLVTDLREYDPISDIIDFGTFSEDMSPPGIEKRRFILPWLTALQRAYLDDPPEQPLSLIDMDQELLPPEIQRYEPILFKRINVTGFSRADIKSLDKRHNQVLNDRAGVADITRVLYAVDQTPTYQSLIPIPPIESRSAWIEAWLVYRSNPHYRIGESTPLSDNLSETFDDLMSSIFLSGDRMTMSEILASVLYDDRSRSPQVALEYATGENKLLVDQIAKQLRLAGWQQRKVQRWGNRRIRWINPELHAETELSDEREYEEQGGDS